MKLTIHVHDFHNIYLPENNIHFDLLFLLA